MKRPSNTPLPKRQPLGTSIKAHVVNELERQGLGAVEVRGLLDRLRAQARSLVRRGKGLGAVLLALDGKTPKPEQLVDGLNYLRDEGACLFARSEVGHCPWCRDCGPDIDLIVRGRGEARTVICAECGQVVEERAA